MLNLFPKNLLLRYLRSKGLFRTQKKTERVGTFDRERTPWMVKGGAQEILGQSGGTIPTTGLRSGVCTESRTTGRVRGSHGVRGPLFGYRGTTGGVTKERRSAPVEETDLSKRSRSRDPGPRFRETTVVRRPGRKLCRGGPPCPSTSPVELPETSDRRDPCRTETVTRTLKFLRWTRRPGGHTEEASSSLPPQPECLATVPVTPKTTLTS